MDSICNVIRSVDGIQMMFLFCQVVDLAEDLQSGTHLCALVEQLQGKPLKPSWHARPASRHHSLENVTAALRAIEADGVKLVNIGENFSLTIRVVIMILHTTMIDYHD